VIRFKYHGNLLVYWGNKKVLVKFHEMFGLMAYELNKKGRLNMQLTIRMPDEHLFKIEKLAKQMGLKKSDIARMAIKKYISDNEIREEVSPYERAKHLLGIAESGVTDLGQNHRKHLIKKIKGLQEQPEF